MTRFKVIETSPYFSDIQGQPGAIRDLLAAGIPDRITTLLDEMASFERIFLTGMGSSLNALYPSYLRLSEAGLPVWQEDTAELLINLRGRIKGKTLFWIASQSGESAETIQLLNELSQYENVTILGFTNYPESNLGRKSHYLFNIFCGPENTVSTKSYLNTLLATGMSTSRVLKEDLDPELSKLPDVLDEYLGSWINVFDSLDSKLTQQDTFIIGRGESMAAARTGSLIIKEASRKVLESLTTAQFRHGPLEMASEKVAVLIFEGSSAQQPLNSLMFEDLIRLNANPIWISSEANPLHPGIAAPQLTSQLTRAIGEIVVLEVLTLVFATRKGDEPGKFRQISKITSSL